MENKYGNLDCWIRLILGYELFLKERDKNMTRELKKIYKISVGRQEIQSGNTFFY